MNFVFLCSQVKSETGKKQEVMTLSDSDEVQTISSGSDDNKEREKVTLGEKKGERWTNTGHLLIYRWWLRGFEGLHLFLSHSCCCSPGPGVTKKQVAVKSTRGIALKGGHGMMVKTGTPGGGGGPGGPGGKTGQQGQPGGGGENTPKNTRLFFDGEESCYIIDAKLEGNLGRYLNVSVSHERSPHVPVLIVFIWSYLLFVLQHSCSPNLFVQNVFVDTHDLRFPWVAFFASKWVLMSVTDYGLLKWPNMVIWYLHHNLNHSVVCTLWRLNTSIAHIVKPIFVQ